MLKASNTKILKLLLNLMNKIKNICKCPKQWAIGITSLLLKEGDDTDPNNYRAITVTDALSKVLAIMINERLGKWSAENKVQRREQIGFEKKCRPADHLFVLKTLINHYNNKGKKLFACFVDFKKAFDSVWRLGMIYKLLQMGMNRNYVKLIQHMYDQSNQSLKINQGLSRSFATHRGVRQGCILSPRLFNLFINDLPQIFDESCKPAQLNQNTHLSCLMYADDLIILSETEEGMQNCLNRLDKYTKEWNLEVNIRKTKTMIFQRGGIKKSTNFSLGSQKLENTQSYKYLGTIISNTGNFKLNHASIKKKGIRASFLITKNIGPYCKPSTAIKIYEKVVEPILMYNCEITCAFLPPKWNIETFKKKIWNTGEEMNKVTLGFLRQILGIGKKSTNIAIHGETGKYPICIKIFTQIIKYWERLRTGEVSDLLKTSFELNKSDHMEGKQNWMRIIEFLLKSAGLADKDTDCCTKISKVFTKKVQNEYRKWWSHEIKNTSKLDFYSIHKKIFRFEPYLDLIARDPRIYVTKLRISSHCLPVEIQRYHKKHKKGKNEPALYVIYLKRLMNTITYYVAIIVNSAASGRISLFLLEKNVLSYRVSTKQI